MDLVLQTSTALQRHSALTFEKINEFINSKQSLRLDRDIAAAGNLRRLSLRDVEGATEILAFVHSTRTKTNWYLVSAKISTSSIVSVECV